MPKEVTKEFLLRLPKELFKQLDREVKSQKSNRTQVTREALENYLNGKQLERDLEK